jgi:hypothetical protein
MEMAGYAVDVEKWEPGFVHIAWRSATSADNHNDADVVIGRDDANWHEEIPVELTRGEAGERLSRLIEEATEPLYHQFDAPDGHTLAFGEPLLFEDAQDAVKAEGLDPNAGRFIVFMSDIHGRWALLGLDASHCGPTHRE